MGKRILTDGLNVFEVQHISNKIKRVKMGNKILIPTNADCFRTSRDGKIANYYVRIESNKEFEVFCDEHNIGYHDGARRDVVKSSNSVFTSNIEVFINFPKNTEII